MKKLMIWKRILTICLCLAMLAAYVPNIPLRVTAADSDLAGNVIVVTETGYSYAGERAENLFDHNANTKWCGAMWSEETSVVFCFEYPAKLNSYYLTTANDTGYYPERNWLEWTIYGSDSDNGDWTTVHYVTDAVLPSENFAESDLFEVNNDNAYRYYKLVIHHTVDDDLHQMADISFDVSYVLGEDDYVGSQCSHANAYDWGSSDWWDDYEAWALFDSDPYTVGAGDVIGVVYDVFYYDCPVQISSYTMTTAYDIDIDPGQNWDAWTLYAGTDSEGPWVQIHQVSNAQLSSEGAVTSDAYLVNMDKSYQYYKLVLDSTAGSDCHKLGDINLKAICESCNSKINGFNINVETDGNGTVAPMASRAKPGETVDLNILPNSGYYLSDCSVWTETYGEYLEFDYNTNSFVMPEGDVTIYAGFSPFDGFQGCNHSGKPVVVSSVGETEYYEEAYRLFDDNPLTMWRSTYDKNDPASVIFRFATPVNILSYTLTSAIGYSNETWGIWTIYGSSSLDGEWTVVHSGNRDMLSVYESRPSDVIQVDAKTAYRYYKLTINDNLDFTPQKMAEMSLHVCCPACSVGAQEYAVNLQNVEHGSVVASANSAAEGTIVELTAKPDAGYQLGPVTVMCGGTLVTVDDNCFVMPAGDVTVVPSFVRCTHCGTPKIVSERGWGYSDEPAENMLDNNPSTMWRAKGILNSAGDIVEPSFVFQYDFPVKLTSYTLTIMYDHFGPANWTDWKLYGGGTKDGRWVLLDDVKNAQLTTEWQAISDPFVIDQPDYYRYYKLILTDDNVDDKLMGELNLEVACPTCGDATVRNIKVLPAEHGTVSVPLTKAPVGATVELDVKPDWKYGLDSLEVWYGNKELGNHTYVPVEDNTFIMPNKDITIQATFKETDTIELYLWTENNGWGDNAIRACWEENGTYMQAGDFTIDGGTYAYHTLSVPADADVDFSWIVGEIYWICDFKIFRNGVEIYDGSTQYPEQLLGRYPEVFLTSWADEVHSIVAWNDDDHDGVIDLNENRYLSLYDALDAGGTATLYEDYDLAREGTVYMGGSDDRIMTVLDLNGKEITYTGGGAGIVIENATLTLRDSSLDKSGLIQVDGDAFGTEDPRAKLFVYEGTVNGHLDMISSTCSLLGGRFSDSTVSNWTMAGYTAILNEETGLWEVASSDEAQNLGVVAWNDTDDDGLLDENESAYTDLSQAFNAGGIVKLYREVKYDQTIEIGKDAEERLSLTIDLNGKLIISECESVFWDIYNADVFIRDYSEAGSGYLMTSGTAICKRYSDTKLYVFGGTYVSQIKDVDMPEGNGYILGGAYRHDPSRMLFSDAEATYVQRSSLWTVTWGSSPDPADYPKVVAWKDTDNDGVIDEGEQTFENLEEALNTGGTIKLYRNYLDTIEVNTDIAKDANDLLDVTLDLNGYTFRRRAGELFQIYNAHLTITDSSAEQIGILQIDGTGIVLHEHSSKLTVNGGTVRSESTGLQIDHGAVVVNGGAIRTGDNGIILEDGSLVINNGTIQAGDRGIVLNNGTVDINGGLVIAHVNGIVVNNGTMTINRGTIQLRNHSILIYGGNLIINGGFISCNYSGPDTDLSAVWVYGGTLTMNGGHLYCASEYFYSINAAGGCIFITGGTIGVEFFGQLETRAGFYADNSYFVDRSKFVITGGTFCTDPYLWLPTGYKATIPDEAGWIVQKIPDGKVPDYSQAVAWLDADEDGVIDPEERFVKSGDFYRIANFGGLIRLNRTLNLRVEGNIVIDQADLTLDLNGCIVTNDGFADNGICYGNISLTVIDSSSSKSGTVALLKSIHKDSRLTLLEVNFMNIYTSGASVTISNCSSQSRYSTAIDYSGEGMLIIDQTKINGYVNVKGGTAVITDSEFHDTVTIKNSNVTMEDVFILSGSSDALIVSNSDLSISSSFVRTYKTNAISMSGGNLEINSCEVEGYENSIYMSGGNLVIDGAKLERRVWMNSGSLILNGSSISSRTEGIWMNEGTLVIDDSTINSYDEILRLHGGTATFNSGTFEMNVDSYSGFFIYGGTVILNDVTLNSQKDGICIEGGTAIVNGGNISATDCAVYVDGGQCYINGGSVESVKFGVYLKNGTVTTTGGTLRGSISTLYYEIDEETGAPKGEFILQGGFFYDDPSRWMSLTGEYYVQYHSDISWWEVKVANSGTTPSLDGVVVWIDTDEDGNIDLGEWRGGEDKLQVFLDQGGTIRLYADVSYLGMEPLYIRNGVTVTLDLNGKTLASGTRDLLQIEDANVTIIDSSTDKNGSLYSLANTIICTDEAANLIMSDSVELCSYGNAAIQVQNGNVTLDDARVIADNYGVEALGGVVTLNNVTITNNDPLEGASYDQCCVRVCGGNVQINGGVYRSYSYTDELTCKNLQMESGNVTLNGGSFSHDPFEFITYATHHIVYNQDTEMYDVKLLAAGDTPDYANAIAWRDVDEDGQLDPGEPYCREGMLERFLKQGGLVRMNSDYTHDKSSILLSDNLKLTLDLNGKSLGSSEGAVFRIGDADVKIIDSSAPKSGCLHGANAIVCAIACTSQNSKLTISDPIKITGTYGISVSNGNVIVNNARFETHENGIQVTGGRVILNNVSILNTYLTRISSENYCAIDVTGGNVYINGGVYINEQHTDDPSEATCVYVSDGQLIIHDGSFSSDPIQWVNPLYKTGKNKTSGLWDVLEDGADIPSGDGTKASPFKISHMGQLCWFAEYVNQGGANRFAHAELTADIDAQGRLHTPIGNRLDSEFNGTFDGKGHRLIGFIFDDETADYVGVFGLTGSQAIIQNLELKSATWIGANYVGGIVGKNGGTVINCMSRADVSGISNVGGVVGGNYGYIVNCFFNGNTPVNTAGGVSGAVAGENHHSATNCYFYMTDGVGCGYVGSDAVDNEIVKPTMGKLMSGEVAYKLGDAFGQRLGMDWSPALGGQKVYYGYTYCGDTEKVYTNNAQVFPEKIDHDWQEASCTESKTCLVCNLIEGEPLGHSLQDATCTEPKICSVCGIAEGDPLGHSWQDATCTEPKTCSACNVTEGEPLGHSWHDATCTESKTCSACNVTEGEPLGHSWQDATCTEPKTCPACGITEGDPLGHIWHNATCTEPKTCSVCNATEGDPLGHSWQDATCTESKYCPVCGIIEGDPLGHSTDSFIIEWNWYDYGDGIYYAYVTQYCDICGDYLDSDSGEAELLEETAPVNCLNPGSRIWRYTCIINGQEYSQTHTVAVYNDVHIVFDGSGFCTSCGGYQKPTVDPGEDPEWEYDDVYLIYNAGQLYWFADYVNNDNTNISGKLMADIDLNPGYTFNADGTYTGGDSPRAWTPIGTTERCYSGNFDGNGKVISGAYAVCDDSFVGLFGNTDYYYEIKNLGVTNSYFKGIDHVGGLIGYAYTIVRNCYVTDTVYVCADSAFANLIGYNGGEVYNCYAMGDTLIGFNYGSCYNCYALTEGDGITAVLAVDFVSGKVAYLLQSNIQGEEIYDEETWEIIGTNQVWGQTIGMDFNPVLNSMEVYEFINCRGEIDYSNKQSLDGHSWIDATCTDAKTCFVCGNTEGEALGHSFENGGCTVCGEADPNYEKPVVKPTLTLKAPALEFKDMIKVIAFFTAENLDDVVEMGMLTYTEKVDVVDVATAAHVVPGATFDPSSGRYFASSQGIHAKYLGDTVYLACYAKLTDGTYVYTKLAGYGPLTYATNQLNKSTDMKLKQLCAAMLNYGAAAQNYFGYNTNVLANSTLTAEQIALPEAYTSDMVGTVPAADAAKQGEFANNKGFSVRKPAVSFEGAFSINYFFTPAYTPVDGITLYYWSEADFNAVDVLTVENASGAIAMTDEGSQYRGDIEGIAAKDLSKAVYVAAVYSDGTTTWTSGVLGYSIGAYCASQATKGGTMADLAMATAVYGYHAKQYFG